MNIVTWSYGLFLGPSSNALSRLPLAMTPLPVAKLSSTGIIEVDAGWEEVSRVLTWSEGHGSGSSNNLSLGFIYGTVTVPIALEIQLGSLNPYMSSMLLVTTSEDDTVCVNHLGNGPGEYQMYQGLSKTSELMVLTHPSEVLTYLGEVLGLWQHSGQVLEIEDTRRSIRR